MDRITIEDVPSQDLSLPCTVIKGIAVLLGGHYLICPRCREGTRVLMQVLAQPRYVCASCWADVSGAYNQMLEIAVELRDLGIRWEVIQEELIKHYPVVPSLGRLRMEVACKLSEK